MYINLNVKQKIIGREYYMAAQRYKNSVWVLINML